MKRKLVCILFAFAVLQTVITETLAATGEIRIKWEEAAEVTVYKVGEPEGDHHRLSERYGGGTVSFDDSLSENLAAWLAQKASDGITMEVSGGMAEFTGLEEGLYLVAQTKGEKAHGKFSPFLVTIPWDGSMWEVEVTPADGEAPQTGDAVLWSINLLFSSSALLIAFRRKIKLLTKSA